MIRLGNRIRLTEREIQRFKAITGFAPRHVRTLEDLDRYVRRCKRYFWGESYETRLLHFRLDAERVRSIHGEKGLANWTANQRAGSEGKEGRTLPAV